MLVVLRHPPQDLFAGITSGSFEKAKGITPAIEDAIRHAVKRT